MNARGFTLIELLVGGAIGVLAVTMVLGVFISQNASFQSLDLVRQMNANARDASLELENSLKRAGYGIDPSLAFDFSCPGQAVGTKCHDSYNGTDDLRFYARNPNYVYTPQNPVLGCVTVGGCFGGGAMWSIVAATSTTITAALGSLDVIQKGRIVMALCSDSSHPVYGKITANAPGPGNVFITPQIFTHTGGTADPSSLIGDSAFSCHNGGALFLVDQYHYYVTKLNNEPWLVLDTGIDYDGLNDINNLIPVARGVEEMQVAYLYAVGTGTAPDSNHDWIVGNDATVSAVEEPDPTAARPLNGAANFSLNPGNIRGVRVSMLVRSPIPDRRLGASFLGDPALKFENRTDVSAVTLGQYRRMPITLSLAIRNMGSANPYLFF